MSVKVIFRRSTLKPYIHGESNFNISTQFGYQDENGRSKVGKSCSWIHSDIMDDNIHMEPCGVNSCFIGNAKTTCLVKNGSLNVDGDSAQRKTWCPSHILDFSNLSIGWCLFIICFYLLVNYKILFLLLNLSFKLFFTIWGSRPSYHGTFAMRL